jgi:hypothetical protein
MIASGRERSANNFTKVAGDGARVEFVEVLADTVDGLTLDRFKIHLVQPLDPQRKSILSTLAHNFTYADKSRTAIIDVDQQSYDRRLFRNDWTANQRLAAAITVMLMLFLLGVTYVVDHYRTDHLHGPQLMSALTNVIAPATTTE